jgi:TIR domain
MEGHERELFISWSLEPSRSVARALYDWLPGIVQHVEPWMSEADIESGGRWNAEIAAALNQSDFGIICTTPANQERPWLMFEAGALAKHLDAARVIPLYIGLRPEDVGGPLASFQGRELNEAGMRKLVQDLANSGGRSLAQRVDRLFNLAWPQLAAQVQDAMRKAPEQKAHRTEREMLQELVSAVRRMELAQPAISYAPFPTRLRIGDTITFPDGRSMRLTSEDDVQKAMYLLIQQEWQTGPPWISSLLHGALTKKAGPYGPAGSADEPVDPEEGRSPESRESAE